MSDLVKATVDREAARVGVSRQILAGWLLGAGWTPERFLEAAKDEPDWHEVFRKPEPRNPWMRIVEHMRARAPTAQRPSRDGRAVEARDHDSRAQRAADTVDCRVFYAQRDWYAAIDADEERNGPMSAVEYSMRKAAFERWCQGQYGKHEPDPDWLERHLKWHADRGTDPW